jgi:hypothetical protein
MAEGGRRYDIDIGCGTLAHVNIKLFHLIIWLNLSHDTLYLRM